MIGSTTIKNKLVKKQNPVLKNGGCKPCFSGKNKICCKQVVSVTTFKSNATLKTDQIFHQLNCKTMYIIYLSECLKCQIQYVRNQKPNSI